MARTQSVEGDTAVRWHSLLQQIINTAELFELILLQLGIRDLLTGAQRVSRNWKAFIEHSPALQRHLFFLPDHRPPLEGSDGDSGMEFCPLLVELFPVCFTRGDVLPHGLEDYAQQSFVKTLAAFMQPGASWRRMLVQQRPPITHIGRWRLDYTWTGHMSFSVKIDAYHPPRSQLGAETEWNTTSAESGDDTTSGADQGGADEECKAQEDRYLRMGVLYDLVTREIRMDGPTTRLFWTSASPAERGAFVAQLASDTSRLAPQSRHAAEVLAQCKKMADSCGLVMLATQTHGWCGTMASWSRESITLRNSFLHPDGPWGRGNHGPKQFDTVYQWKGNYVGPGLEDDLDF